MTVEGHKQEYMYFSPEKLMEGVMVHVGLHMTEQLSPDMIKSFIDSALEFHNMKAIHKEMQKVQREKDRISRKYRNISKRLIDERRRVLRLCRLAKDCTLGKSSLTDALAALHARAHQDGMLKELSLKDFDITSDQIVDEEDDDEAEK
jgi:hypothetical protein